MSSLTTLTIYVSLKVLLIANTMIIKTKGDTLEIAIGVEFIERQHVNGPMVHAVVVTEPEVIVDKEGRRQFRWTARIIPSGYKVDYLLSEGCEAYGPGLYSIGSIKYRQRFWEDALSYEEMIDVSTKKGQLNLSLFEPVKKPLDMAANIMPEFPKTIFIHDDIVTNALKYKLQWEKEGYTVITNNDINIAYSVIVETKPDLVICSIHESEHEGYGLCSLLKKEKLTKDIPFCFMAESDRFKDFIMCLESGANGYVTNSISSDAFLTYIPKLIKCKADGYVPLIDNPWSIYKEISDDCKNEENFYSTTIRDALLQIEQEKYETWARKIWQMLESSSYFTEEMLIDDGKPQPLPAPYIEFTIDNEQLYNEFKKVVQLYKYIWNLKLLSSRQL